jgi:hypothetical protein
MRSIPPPAGGTGVRASHREEASMVRKLDPALIFALAWLLLGRVIIVIIERALVP